MRSRLTLLLAVLATVALMVPAMATAETVTLSVDGEPLEPGAEITGTSTNSVFHHSYGASDCPQVDFRFELVQNEDETAELEQLGYVEVPQVCIAFEYSGVGKDIRIVKKSFALGVGNGGIIELYPDDFPELENPTVRIADFGGVEFDYEYRYTSSSEGAFSWPCHATGEGKEAWASPTDVAFSALSYSQLFSSPCESDMKFEGNTISAGSLIDVSSGKPISITVAE